jgi:hypothetical protein
MSAPKERLTVTVDPAFMSAGNDAVPLAEDGDDIATSDPGDIEPLAVLAGRHVESLHV